MMQNARVTAATVSVTVTVIKDKPTGEEGVKLPTTHNQFYNILRLFYILPNFPFTTSETMHNYYL